MMGNGFKCLQCYGEDYNWYIDKLECRRCGWELLKYENELGDEIP